MRIQPLDHFNQLGYMSEMSCTWFLVHLDFCDFWAIHNAHLHDFFRRPLWHDKELKKSIRKNSWKWARTGAIYYFLPNLKSSATIHVKFTCTARFLAVLNEKGKFSCIPRVTQVLYPDGRGLIFLGASYFLEYLKRIVSIGENWRKTEYKMSTCKKNCAKCVFVFKFISILTNTNNSFQIF